MNQCYYCECSECSDFVYKWPMMHFRTLKKEETKMINVERTVTSCEKCSHNKVCQHKHTYSVLLDKLEKEFNRIVNNSANIPDWLVEYYRPRCTQYREEVTQR